MGDLAGLLVLLGDFNGLEVLFDDFRGLRLVFFLLVFFSVLLLTVSGCMVAGLPRVSILY